MGAQPPTEAVILVVDDDDGIRQTISQVLKYRGYISATARSGGEALSYLRAGKPVGLIVLDQNLGDMPGRRVREELKRDPRLAKIPVIVFSGTEPQGPTDDVMAFVRKAFDHPGKLFSLIDEACGKSRA